MGATHCSQTRSSPTFLVWVGLDCDGRVSCVCFHLFARADRYSEMRLRGCSGGEAGSSTGMLTSLSSVGISPAFKRGEIKREIKRDQERDQQRDQEGDQQRDQQRDQEGLREINREIDVVPRDEVMWIPRDEVMRSENFRRVQLGVHQEAVRRVG